MIFKINDGTEFNMNYEIIENVVPQTTLFIHGNLSSNRWWYPSVEIWKSQAAGKSYKGHIILAEFRGCGLSSAPRSESEINMRTLANDFLELINHLDLQKLNLVGHSTGGIISAIMLSKNKDLFNKIVLLDPIGPKGFKLPISRMIAHEPMKFSKKLTEMAVGSIIHNNNYSDDFFKNVIVEDAYKAVKNIGSAVFKDVANLDVSKEFKNIDNHVLVLHGEFDKFLPVDDSKLFASLFKNGDFMLVPNHGHCLNLEDPVKFCGIAGKFLFAL
ncbi:MAG: alpha/beta fold hydrolase [Neisseriaceae bacterium]